MKNILYVDDWTEFLFVVVEFSSIINTLFFFLNHVRNEFSGAKRDYLSIPAQ